MKTVYRTILIVLISALLVVFSSAIVHAYTAPVPAGVVIENGMDQPLSDILEPEKDTCIQCHVDGSFTNIWTPFLRWVFVGAAGIALLFGVARSASVWKTRAAWVPIPQRISSWLDDRYQLSEVLKPILSKPACIPGISARRRPSSCKTSYATRCNPVRCKSTPLSASPA